MLAMYDEKEILLEYIESERYEAAKEAAKEAEQKGIEQGKEQGLKEGAREAAIQMLKEGILSPEQIIKYFSVLSVEDVEELQKKLTQNV